MVQQDARFEQLGLKVGSFLAVLILLLALMLGVFLWRNDLLQPTDPYVCEPEDATGMFPGMDITLHGIRVGRLVSLQLTESGKPAATLRIRRDTTPWITEGSSVRLSGIDFLDTPYLALRPGAADAPGLPAGSQLPFEREATLGEIASSLEKQLQPAIEEVSALLAELNRPEGDVRLSLLNLRRISESLAEEMPIILSDTRNSAGTARKFLEETTAETSDLMTSVTRLREITDELQHNLPFLLEDSKESLGSVRRTTAMIETLVGDSSPSLRETIEKSGTAASRADSLLGDIRKIWFFRIFLPKEPKDPEHSEP